tara:strand:- start:956 stop:1630 length:675 start_codon:yes stop_codon:yes gene_type:complete
MKKSQLRNIIRESIKQLMTESHTSIHASGNGTFGVVRLCDSVHTATGAGGGICVKVGPPGGASPVGAGDLFKITHWQGGFSSIYIGENAYFSEVLGTCNSGGYRAITSTDPCPRCCSTGSGWGGGATGGFSGDSPQGTCWQACNPTSAGSCTPSAWPNHANWTNTFTNTVNNMNPNNPNQPCNFLTGKVAQFTASANVPGAGNAQNIWNCKLDLATQLHTQNNC